ncbi:HAD family hydrolase [Halorussus rarus]|uniref:HAD family hydrolase n=1 Tax=Halorussus TaxID=1070314 RepID=UPI000E20D2AE|nr:HAD family hydrolase [Halorussus rarus]NHN57644.1 HAD family hydrolase [Halorussus sp. JP-T4]
MPGGEPESDYRAVFWDIGGVVLDPDSVREAHEAFVRRVVAEHASDTSVGEEIETADAIETWRTAVGEYFRARDGTEFRSARRGYHRAVAEVVGEEIPEDEWRPLFEAATAGTLRPEPDAAETVERLAETDLHVGVVSDVDTEEGLRILEEFGVRDRFDSITTSEMVGRTKPDRRMFETALEEAGLSPDAAPESVMIGDRYDHDMAGAKELGLTTVAYGAEDGPAVDYEVENLREVLAVVGVADRDDSTVENREN